MEEMSEDLRKNSVDDDSKLARLLKTLFVIIDHLVYVFKNFNPILKNLIVKKVIRIFSNLNVFLATLLLSL